MQTISSQEIAGLTIYDLSGEAELETFEEQDNLVGSSTRAAVCSGVARQFAEGQDIEEIKDCYSDFEIYIDETFAYLEEEDQLDAPDVEQLFYDAMLEIVESAIFG